MEHIFRFEYFSPDGVAEISLWDLAAETYVLLGLENKRKCSQSPHTKRAKNESVTCEVATRVSASDTRSSKLPLPK